MNEKMNILMVDDRPENLFVLETVLQDEEVHMDKANSGNEALSMLLEKEYALVLMDVQMPELDGFETAELMKGMNKTKDIPIIFITAISKEERYVFKGYTVGAIDYIYKPVEPIILKSKVRIFAELHRQKLMYKEQANTLNSKVQELEVVKSQLLELNSRLVQLSTMDALTKINNRRAFDENLYVEWGRSKRVGDNLSLLLMDIDYFKQFNDEYGHLVGDECLEKVAEKIKDSLSRSADYVARFGGEEFVVILPNTDIEGAKAIAEHIRMAIEELEIENAGSTVSEYVTISIGVTTRDDQCKTVRGFLESADKALYTAKDLGRNQVVVYKKDMAK